MSLALYAHPFSSYCQKVLLALYENGTPFEYRHLGEEAHAAALRRLWPIGRFPLLVDGGRVLPEATAIIEYLHLHHPGPVPLLPADPDQAVQVRMLDRFFDNYVSTPQQKVVADALRPDDQRDPYGVAQARAQLETAYAWLEAQLADGRRLGGRGGPSAWPTVGRRRSCSMPTGPSRSRRPARGSRPTGPGSWPGRRCAARWTRRGRTGPSFPSAPPTATDRPHVRAQVAALQLGPALNGC